MEITSKPVQLIPPPQPANPPGAEIVQAVKLEQLAEKEKAVRDAISAGHKSDGSLTPFQELAKSQTGVISTATMVADDRINDFYKPAHRKGVELSSDPAFVHFRSHVGGRVHLPNAGDVLFVKNFYSTRDKEDIAELRALCTSTKGSIMEFKKADCENYPEVSFK